MIYTNLLRGGRYILADPEKLRQSPTGYARYGMHERPSLAYTGLLLASKETSTEIQEVIRNACFVPTSEKAACTLYSPTLIETSPTYRRSRSSSTFPMALTLQVIRTIQADNRIYTTRNGSVHLGGLEPVATSAGSRSRSSPRKISNSRRSARSSKCFQKFHRLPHSDRGARSNAKY